WILTQVVPSSLYGTNTEVSGFIWVTIQPPGTRSQVYSSPLGVFNSTSSPKDSSFIDFRKSLGSSMFMLFMCRGIYVAGANTSAFELRPVFELNNILGVVVPPEEDLHSFLGVEIWPGDLAEVEAHTGS